MIGITADLLASLRAAGAILPAAPTDDQHAAFERRRLDEVHDCLICGQRAETEFIAHTEDGPRWLDLCWPHYEDVVMLVRDERERRGPWLSDEIGRWL